MFSPKHYTVRKYPLSLFIKYNFNIPEEVANDIQYQVLQSDTMLLRQIRLVSHDDSDYNPFLIYIDATGAQNKPDVVKHLMQHGAKIGKRKFSFGERSASMVRQCIFSMVESHIWPELNRRISMEVSFSENPVVLSKWMAYRGLMMSSCHCIPLNEWFPKIIVVPDHMLTIPDQKIKCLCDKKMEFVDKKTGKKREWVQKDIKEDTINYEINAFDGCGIAHPSLMRQIEKKLNTSEHISSMIFRMPYFKGVFNEMDYVSFYEERGVTEITDIWGVKHSVARDAEPMFIAGESMFKGVKYFKRDGTIADWERYKQLLLKYNHAMGVAKWNYQFENEPLETRSNYQILVTLDLPYDGFKHLADKSVDWYQKITSNTEDGIFHTNCFLGLMADDVNPLTHYAAALARNPEMIHESSVKAYIHSLLDKYRNDFKCGKLFLDATYKFLAPDLIAFMEGAAGLPIVGCLESDEFYTFDRRGAASGWRVVDRNPHLASAEHAVLKGVNNELTQKYCSHLENVAMINVKSITPQRLNGADFDGDLVLVIDSDIMLKGIDRNARIVCDTQDKITALAQLDNLQNRLDCVLRGLKSQIGEYANYGCAFHNKVATTEKTKKEYENYIDILSICMGKEIDFSKTGVKFSVPRNIASYGRPLPRFMKYAGPYYARQHNLSNAHSNMNLLCMDLERWERGVRWHKEPAGSFDWHIMYDSEIGYDQDVFDEIEAVFLDFNKYRKNQLELEKKAKNWKIYRKELEGIMTKEEAKTYETNWQAIYNVYRNKCKLICPDVRELANILVVLCYEKYPNKFKKFLWHMAGAGVVENIKPIPVQLPVHDPNGKYEYLGQRYSLAEPRIYEARVK